MAKDGNDEDIELAENLAEPADALASGSVVGTVNGLIWSDNSGFDVVSVEMRDVSVAVPIDSDVWRGAAFVELNFSETLLADAPRVQDLEATGGIGAVEAVSDHFAMPLSGPPPGPATGTLPPWWHKHAPGGITPGEAPNPTEA
jgi:hypothetical protein